MKVLLVSASSRSNSQSHRICMQIKQRLLDDDSIIHDLYEQPLPLWMAQEDNDHKVSQEIASWQNNLTKSDAFIFVVPEWHGAAPPAIKNALQWSVAGSLAHKPCLLVGISSSVGGALAISDMRSTTYKNSRLLYLPEHIIIRDVEKLWSDNAKKVKSTHYIEERLEVMINQLRLYTEALAPCREQFLLDIAKYPNGMS